MTTPPRTVEEQAAQIEAAMNGLLTELSTPLPSAKAVTEHYEALQPLLQQLQKTVESERGEQYKLVVKGLVDADAAIRTLVEAVQLAGKGELESQYALMKRGPSS